MINVSNIILSASVLNPDLENITKKNKIDISLVDFDVSASGIPVKRNYIETEIIVHNTGSFGTENADYYFTPTYNESISYDIWKRRINKVFRELGAR